MPLTVGRWAHIAIVYDSDVMLFYLDGARTAKRRSATDKPADATFCRCHEQFRVPQTRISLQLDTVPVRLTSFAIFNALIDDRRQWRQLLAFHSVDDVLATQDSLPIDWITANDTNGEAVQ